ncbi:MAG: membrane protein insertion efficiency factor YidD [Candidatus Eiseniibacteriota bacterium]
MKTVVLGAIRLYRRFASPLLPPACRYLPSCSAYAEEAVLLHGVARGLLLSARRVARCHPWGGHGVDLVPAAPKRKEV